jgi:hypothetical protein
MVLALAAGCSGPPVATGVTAEPVCADFELGVAHTKMRGGLRVPVSLVVKEGDDVVMRTTVYGLRHDKDLPTRVVLPDANEEYTVEWAQCENERAPRPVEDPTAIAGKSTVTPRREGPVDYECGNSVVYKTDKLVTTRGNPASHALTYPPPPKPECWQSDAPAAAPDAGAPPAADAGAAPADADAGASADAGATDAGIADAAAATAADAGAAPSAPTSADAGAAPKKKKPAPPPPAAPDSTP